MSTRLTSLPDTNIFSIDPATKQPYMTIEYADQLIKHHVHRYASYLLNRHEMEDLVQELLMRLCKAAYDPSKGTASRTWALLVIKTGCHRINVGDSTVSRTASDRLDENGNRVKTKSGNVMTKHALMMSESFSVDSEGFTTSTLDWRPDTVTPLDHLLAQERIVEHNTIVKQKQACGHFTREVPKDYKGFSVIKGVEPPKTMKCRGPCGYKKYFVPHFFARDKNRRWGLATICRRCKKTYKKAWYAALPKDQKR